LDKLTSHTHTHLELSYNFNQKDDIPFNIISIKLNCNNRYYINNLPNNIEKIVSCMYFNLELNNLQSSIKKTSIFN